MTRMRDNRHRSTGLVAGTRGVLASPRHCVSAS